ncbi:phosphoesterase family-domain-containing protein [Xylariaceae sp. FL0804]|nr:phosphoesterase family-domain-containing protein [Xylariaceae sp. FL0804]
MGNHPSVPKDPGTIARHQASALTLSPTSNVPGKFFDRFVQIWLENQDFEIAEGDPSLAFLTSLGIELVQYRALAHPSQPNYIAVVGGSRHHVHGDDWHEMNKDVETIIDLLEAKGVSWGVYGEDLPYTGFLGDFENQKTGANAYVRKHNPVISYKSVTENPNRLALSKNFTMFEQDLANDKLPQWMFITPNMRHDGHDTDVGFAGAWTLDFLLPLLRDARFNKGRTLVQLTFDESEDYLNDNRVFTLLLGGAVPPDRVGTIDYWNYNHYSVLRTVEVNWALGSLGRRDADASPFEGFGGKDGA